jgi:hypothetical protein
MKRVLIACEFSGVVREAFRLRGWDAWSCDILPTAQDGQHFQCDVTTVLNFGWDLMIAHPPCKYLSYAGSRWWHQPERVEKRADAMHFFMELYNANIKHICIENPRGEPITHVKPSQLIHPYYFGEPFQKRTYLWLKNLPLLYHNQTPNLFDQCKTWSDDKGEMITDRKGKTRAAWYQNAYALPQKERDNVRAKTFQGIADAMATQWTEFLNF